MSERTERERLERLAALDDATPPESQYGQPLVVSGRAVIGHRAPSKLQSPQTWLADSETVVERPDGTRVHRDAYVPATGASKPVPAEVSEHRPRVRPTRSRKGRTSYVVTSTAQAMVCGTDPVLGEIRAAEDFRESWCPDGKGSDRLVAVPASWARHDDIVTMSARTLAEMATRLTGIELVGMVDGRRNAWHFETEPLMRKRTPSKAERARDLMTPRDTDNPSIARWSGDLLAWFPELSDSELADATEGQQRHYARPTETYRARLGLGAIHPRREQGETGRITDGETVHLIAPHTDPRKAWIGHRIYDRPMTRAEAREARRTEPTAEMPELDALAAECERQLTRPESPQGSARRAPVTWQHHQWTVRASQAKDSRWSVTVYAKADTSTRATPVSRFTARTPRAVALRLSTLKA